MLFHQIQAAQKFSSTLTKFDPRLIPEGPRNPIFNLTIRTG